MFAAILDGFAVMVATLKVADQLPGHFKTLGFRVAALRARRPAKGTRINRRIGVAGKTEASSRLTAV